MIKANKILGGLLLSMTIVSSAMASSAFYANQASANKSAANNLVRLHNYTHDGYMAYATFESSGQTVNLHLDPFSGGSGRDVINYNINSGDYEVCVNVIRDFDGASVFDSCESSGDINIGPYMLGGKPSVKVTK